MQANAATGLWGTAYPYAHQGVVLAPHFGQHTGVGGLLGAGGTLRGLSTHRQPGHDAATVSIRVYSLLQSSYLFVAGKVNTQYREIPVKRLSTAEVVAMEFCT